MLKKKFSFRSAIIFDTSITEMDVSAVKKKVNIIVSSAEGSTINGSNKNDTINGSTDADYIAGGKGNDKIDLHSGGNVRDVISDFENADMIVFNEIKSIAGKIHSTGSEVYLKAGSTDKAIILKDFTTMTFHININGTTYTYLISNSSFFKD